MAIVHSFPRIGSRRACSYGLALALVTLASGGFQPAMASSASMETMGATTEMSRYSWLDWKWLGYMSVHNLPFKKGDVIKLRFFSQQGVELKALSLRIMEDDADPGPRLQQLLDNEHMGVKMGMVTSPGGFNTSLGELRRTYNFYAADPLGFHRVVSEIHHADGRVRTFGAAGEDGSETLVLQAPSTLKDAEPLVFQAGDSAHADASSIHIGLFDEGAGKRLDYQIQYGTPAALTRFEFKPSTDVVGPLRAIVDVFLYTGGSPVKLLSKEHRVNVEASGNHDFVFPDGLGSYKSGTRVFQPRNAGVYECKPFPYSGFCNQWGVNNTHFEPGIGSAWQDAWTLQP